MDKLRKKAGAFWLQIKSNPKETLFFAFIYLIFLVNTTYVAYPDEFINILGGVFLNQGKIPYKEFFDHHLPFAWHLASFILHFSFGSYIAFRVIFATLIFGSLTGLALWIRKRNRCLYHYYLVAFLLYPIMAVYFWFHLYLADSLAVFFFFLIFWLLITESFDGKPNEKIITIATLLTFCLVFSSLTFVYLALTLYLWEIYLLGMDKKKIIRAVIWIIAPYILYLLYICISGAFNDFYFSNVVYNTNHYINLPNYVKGRYFNPLKFGLTLIFNFYSDYLPLLSKIKYLDLYLPIGILGALGTLSLLIMLVINYPVLGLLYFFILSFSAPRSSIKTYTESDYQGCLFLVLGVVSSLCTLYLIRMKKTNNVLFEDLKRAVQALIVIFLLFSFIFLANNTYNKFYLRFTQKMYGIYDLSDTGDFLNKALKEGEYYWVGPYEPQEMFFVKKGKLPGKFPSLLPQFRENEYLKQSFIAQFEVNQPKFIIFKHSSSIFGTPVTEFGAFFFDWLKNNYLSLEEIKEIEVIKNPVNFNFNSDLYILKSEKEQLLERVKAAGYIR